MSTLPQPRQRADALPRCSRHSYFLASCEDCRATQGARIEQIRASLAAR